ncbi:hypothetical protein [Streptomyces sp. JJ36]|uniref:hypothetical protein n=1 Tax=Streptomyces sp. JJ36 TaxID=2736645 RepID=UPI001F2B66AD|nr:hypothetical protein [Streptomyces sp. JJ36]MCF6524142.1 hypothetical protein [Streptomyces sp. JJ36]
MSSLLARVRRHRDRAAGRPYAAGARPSTAGRVHEDIAADLPEEDLGEDLAESLDLYVPGSKPRCEEAEYLDLLQDAIERAAHEG